MPYPTFSAGQRLTAAQLTAMQWVRVNQGSNQTVNNSTTLVDTNLTFNVEANAIYKYTTFLSFTTGTTPDITFEWSVPSGTVFYRWVQGGSTGATGGRDAFTESAFRRHGATSPAIFGGGSGIIYVSDSGLILAGGTAGAVTLRFAQNTANASDTVLEALSELHYLRIG